MSVERHADGTATVRPAPLRYDLTYLVTVSAADAEDGHELLGLTLRALLAQPTIEPAQLPGELRNQALPLIVTVSRPDALADIGTLWGSLGGVRPAVFCTVTMPVEPFQAKDVHLVRSRQLRFANKAPGEAEPVECWRLEERLEVAGKVLQPDGVRPVRGAQVSLREISRSASVDDRGIYRLGPLPPASYTLVVSAPGFGESRREFVVSPNSDGGAVAVAGSADLDVRLEPARAESEVRSGKSSRLPATS